MKRPQQNTPQNTEEEEENNCAWCDAELGIVPEEGKSHGICPWHEQQVWAAYQAAKEQRNAQKVS